MAGPAASWSQGPIYSTYISIYISVYIAISLHISLLNRYIYTPLNALAPLPATGSWP